MKRVIVIWMIIILPISCQEKGKPDNIIKKEKEANQLEYNDGIYIEKYENGNVKIKTVMKDKKIHGEFVEYYESGKVRETGIMSKGIKNGVWKTYYENGEFKEVGQYNNKGELSFKLDEQDFIFDTLLLDSKKIKILIPKNWKTNTSNGIVLCSSRKICHDSVDFCPNITITKEKIQNGLSFSDYIDINVELLKSQSTFVKVVKEYEFTLNGLSTYQTSYLLKSNDVDLGALTTWIDLNGVVYIISGAALNGKEGEFLKYRGLFREIALSFSVIL